MTRHEYDARMALSPISSARRWKGAMWVAWAFILVTSAAAARAQFAPGAGGFNVPGRADSHGWVVLPASGRDRYAVLHLPPRGPSNAAVRAAPDGSMAVAAAVADSPEAIAAFGSTAFLVFPPQSVPDGPPLRRVLGMMTSPDELAGIWVYNAGERLTAVGSIEGNVDLLGFAASARGPVALVRSAATESSASSVRLIVLEAGVWKEIPLPAGWTPAAIHENEKPTAGVTALVSLPDGVGLIHGSGSSPGIWSVALSRSDVSGADSSAAAPVNWVWTKWDLEPGMPPPTGAVMHVQGRFVYATRAPGGSLDLWTISADGSFKLGSIIGVGPIVALAPLEQTGRIAVAWPERADNGSIGPRMPADPAASEEDLRLRYQIREISALTGRLLYSGPQTSGGLISVTQFQVLVLILVGVMVLIMVFVLRPDLPPGGAWVLPAGVALAEPARRVVATAIDLLPALLVASRMSGVGVGEFIAGSPDAGGGAGLLLLLGCLFGGFAHATLCEWLFGKSIGKTLVGCEVIRVIWAKSDEDGQLQPARARPGLWGAIARNVVKWGLPPLALGGLLTPERRHRGDIIAGTAVVIRVEGEETGDSGRD